MKKVISSNDVDCVTVNKANPAHWFGVKCRAGAGFITRRFYSGDASFAVIAIHGLTRGNGLSCYDHPDFSIFLNKLLDNGCEIFEFESWVEFTKWLGAQNPS